MLRYSVLLPESGTLDALARQLSDLESVFDFLGQPYEILWMGDTAALASDTDQQALLTNHPRLRLLRLAAPHCVAAALTAGLSAAHGEVIVTMGAANQYAADQIPQLIAALSRGELACGRRSWQGRSLAWNRLARLPRRIVLGDGVHDPTCLFWAALREAVVGLELGQRMHHYLPTLVTMRGFRVVEVGVRYQGPAPAWGGWPHPLDLLTLWWLRRGHPTAQAVELSHAGEPSLESQRLAHPRYAGGARRWPQAIETERKRDSA